MAVFTVTIYATFVGINLTVTLNVILENDLKLIWLVVRVVSIDIMQLDWRLIRVVHVVCLLLPAFQAPCNLTSKGLRRHLLNTKLRIQWTVV